MFKDPIENYKDVGGFMDLTYNANFIIFMVKFTHKGTF